MLDLVDLLVRLSNTGQVAISFIAIAVVVFAFASDTRIQWPAEPFHLHWSAWAFISIFFVTGTGLSLKTWLAFRRDSVAVTAPSEKQPSGLRERIVECTLISTPEDIAALTEFMHNTFHPRTKRFSTLSRDDRHVTYKTWHEVWPQSMVGIWARRSAASDRKLVGCSILLNLNESTYVRYRNGNVRPWDWGSEHAVTPSCKRTYLFWQTFFCWRKPMDDPSLILTHVAMEHLLRACPGLLEQPWIMNGPLIICPRNTKTGRHNIQTWGANELPQSRGNFRIFEIDCTYHDMDARIRRFRKGLETVNTLAWSSIQ